MKKYTHYLILLALNLLIAGSIFGIYFLYQKIQNALHTQERIKLEQEIQTQQIKNLPELSARYRNILAHEQYFNLLYTEDRVVEIIKDMERLAKEQQVALTITQKEVPLKKAPKKGTSNQDKEGEAAEEAPKELADTLPYPKHIRLELKAIGSYVAIRNFLHKLETAPYALDVLSVQGSVAPKDDDAPVARVQSDNPFLLSTPVEGEEAPPVTQATDILFLIEVALYIQ